MSKPAPAPAASLEVAAAVPNYEVKLFLDATKVLDLELKPSKAADRAFGLKHPSRTIVMQFLDAPRASKDEEKRQLDAAGWNIRLRRFDDTNELELSYKRRYKIEPGQLESVLNAAIADGFSMNEHDYQAQVEWGMERETLSFTNEKPVEASVTSRLELPDLEKSRELAIQRIPKKLDRAKHPGWATGVLATAKLYGPVLGKRWEGDWRTLKLSFEVWLIREKDQPGFTPVVELSFKKNKQEKAESFREELMTLVRDQGWLLNTDVLKTAMILDRY